MESGSGGDGVEAKTRRTNEYKPGKGGENKRHDRTRDQPVPGQGGEDRQPRGEQQLPHKSFISYGGDGALS